MLIVQKFGGSSLADGDRIRHCAGIIKDTYDAGHDVVAVLSARGDSTDELMEQARTMAPSPGGRELDMLLTTGEQVSVALMALCLGEMDCPAVSLTGWQAGVETTDDFGRGEIVRIDPARIRSYLELGAVVVVAGFQGVTRGLDVTTLGRGGSDTTAVALAAALGADRCMIFTDVDGVYTADPRKFPDAVKLEEISYDEMLAMAQAGARVLHDKCVELAKETGVVIEVLSSFEDVPGTVVR